MSTRWRRRWHSCRVRARPPRSTGTGDTDAHSSGRTHADRSPDADAIRGRHADLGIDLVGDPHAARRRAAGLVGRVPLSDRRRDHDRLLHDDRPPPATERGGAPVRAAGRPVAVRRQLQRRLPVGALPAVRAGRGGLRAAGGRERRVRAGLPGDADHAAVRAWGRARRRRCRCDVRARPDARRRARRDDRHRLRGAGRHQRLAGERAAGDAARPHAAARGDARDRVATGRL